MSITKSLHRFLYKLAYRAVRAYWFLVRPKTKSVLCLILSGEGAKQEILLIRHTYDNKGWLFPGGSVNYDEKSEIAIRREIREELGMQLGKVKFLTAKDSFNEYHYSHVDFYVTEVDSQTFQIDDVEIAEARWF